MKLHTDCNIKFLRCTIYNLQKNPRMRWNSNPNCNIVANFSCNPEIQLVPPRLYTSMITKASFIKTFSIWPTPWKYLQEDDFVLCTINSVLNKSLLSPVSLLWYLCKLRMYLTNKFFIIESWWHFYCPVLWRAELSNWYDHFVDLILLMCLTQQQKNPKTKKTPCQTPNKKIPELHPQTNNSIVTLPFTSSPYPAEKPDGFNRVHHDPERISNSTHTLSVLWWLLLFAHHDFSADTCMDYRGCTNFNFLLYFSPSEIIL